LICEHPRVTGDASSVKPSVEGGAPRLPALTGLRIFAALAVYLSHIGPPHHAPKLLSSFLEAGYMGVTLFFVLSGFVLAINYFQTMRHPSIHATWQFAVARFARIYPAYILILAYVLISEHAFGARVDGWWEHVLAIQAWSGSVFEAFKFNGPAWSVSVEVFLYACFPLLVPVLARLRTPRAMLLAAAGVALAMAGLALWFVLSHRSGLPWSNSESAHRWLYVTPLTRLGDFVLGILAARLYLYARERQRVVRAGGPLALASVIVIILLMVWPADLFSAWSWDIAYALPSLALIFGLAVAPRSRLARVLSLPLIVLLGESSYAFYLVHQRALEYFGAPRWGTAVSWSILVFEVLTLGAILCLAVGLHIVVERPVRLYIRRALGSDPRSALNRRARSQPAGTARDAATTAET
jgi:peptidoglycan/LPS O-acetylase OafA/YrhL